jgi:acyl-CoA synthetase (NDP forming)
MTAEPLPEIDLTRIRAIVADARASGRTALLETEARGVLEAMGVPVPAAVLMAADPGADPAAVEAAVAALPGSRVVVRVVAAGVAHKTELGGVAVVARDATAIAAAVEAMRARLRAAGVDDLAGFLVAEYVEHEPGLGGELLVSARWTADAGPVVSVGAGGTEAEAIAADLRLGRQVAILSPALTRREDIEDLLRAVTAVRLATTSLRGRPPRLPTDRLVDVVERFLALAAACVPGDLAELEVNPIVVADGRLVALDALAGLGGRVGAVTVPPARPTWKLPRMLEPRSVAIIGVSAGMNPGHIILRNLLRDGFDAGRIHVIKPGTDVIDGCRCVPDVASLPEKVDLFVVVVSAAQAAEVVTDVVERDAAETILVIPGGLEEKQGSEAIVARMRAAIDRARARPDGGPLLNGGNCLGFRSVPGRCDTMFIPASKLAPPAGEPAPLAIVAQSGAFAITRLGRLADLHPRYLVTVGNQMDLTVGDHVAHLAADPTIAVFGVYLEGYRPLDVVRFVEAARSITDGGRTVVLYRGGRTAAGATASASHTAAIAGDVVATRALVEQAGVLVADSLDEFDDLVRTATLLAGRTIAGRRLGAMSNAGFECVAIGDTLGSLRLATFEPATAARLGVLLAAAGAGGVVDVHNPLDATPMAGDASFAALAEAILASPAVDVGVVGIVPLTATLRTLPRAAAVGSQPPAHDEDLAAPDAVAALLVDLWHRTTKAWVAIVDAGSLYDPFAAALEAGGMPVFRTADRATRALDGIVRRRLG